MLMIMVTGALICVLKCIDSVFRQFTVHIKMSKSFRDQAVNRKCVPFLLETIHVLSIDSLACGRVLVSSCIGLDSFRGEHSGYLDFLLSTKVNLFHTYEFSVRLSPFPTSCPAKSC